MIRLYPIFEVPSEFTPLLPLEVSIMNFKNKKDSLIQALQPTDLLARG